MKQSFVFILVLMLTSCEYFNVKKTSSEAILKEELQTFNWSNVDKYPTFSQCDSTTTNQETKLCFERILNTHIAEFLQQEIIIVSQNIEDTISMKFQISEKGELSLLNAKMDSITIKEIPNIKNLLKKSLDSLPKIFPAIKRGQHVTTEFELPIIIKVN